MNAVTIEISAEKQKKLAEIAAARGVSVEHLYSSLTDHLVSEFEAHSEFRRLADMGRFEVDAALQRLKRD